MLYLLFVSWCKEIEKVLTDSAKILQYQLSVFNKE